MTHLPKRPVPHSLSPRIAVVGGGVSGLSAAYRLQRLMPRAQLRLFESSGRLGGPLQTTSLGELIYERGADSFITKLPWAVALCRELGVEDQLMPTSVRNRRALVLREGKLHPIPAGFVLMRPHQLHSIARSSLLSWQGRLRLCLEPLAPARRPDSFESPDESVAEFATRRLGRESYERLVEPLLAGIYVADGNKLSVAATMPEFLRNEQECGSLYLAARAAQWSSESDGAAARDASGARYSAFVAPRDGLSTIIRALESSLPELDVQLNSPVRRIERIEKVWSVELEANRPLANSEFDGVIVAAPAPRAGAMLDQVDAHLTGLLTDIEYAGSVVATLMYRPDQIGRPLDAFGFVVPAVEQRQIVAASFPSVKFPGRPTGGLTPIRVFMGGALHPHLVDREDADLISIAEQELAPLLSIESKPVATDVVRWPQSMPQYHVGHLQRVEEIRRRIGQLRGLELAGNAYGGVGIPQCIRSGTEAAERLAASLATEGATD